MRPVEILKLSKIVPVVVLEDLDYAVPLANTLLENGINVMEITLRSEVALDSIEAIAKAVPKMHVGAGTVVNGLDLLRVKDAGGEFCFSPGISEMLINESKRVDMPFIPGVATASEVMQALNHELDACKLFPASAVGGVSLLKGFQGPFPTMTFCPTGGINLDNMNEYLALKNVACIGGSWIVPKGGALDEVARLCKEALA